MKTELFIRRPVMTSLIMLGILVFGIIGYEFLPVAALPNVSFPTIQVSAGLPGASPETMGSAVATPLEKQFTTIPGLNSMTSTSSLGSTRITLQFALSRNINAAALDVESAMASATRQLPASMPSPPTFRKVNPASFPVLFLALTSPTLKLSTVDEYAETLLGEQISMVNGVAQVGVFGSMPYAVRIELNPEELASRKIGIDQVATAIKNANVDKPMGTLSGAHKAYNLHSNGQLTDAALYRPLIIAYRNGAPVRLDQVATVENSVLNNRVANWINGSPGVVLAIFRQPGSNTIQVVNGVKALLPRFRAIMPPAMHLAVQFDGSVSIRQSVSEVKFTLFLAVCLVVLVIFLFLRNLSATMIPSLALPMAIIGTFAVMYVFGFTIDNLSLLALTLSVGFVVDDAIVMLENIVRHMEMGKSAMQASLDGAKEIGFTIISMTLALTAVFIPVFFMGGILGRLLHEFAVVIMSAVLVSGVVSLTLTPMLCSRYLRPQHEKKHGWMYRTLENILNTSMRWYGGTLRWALRHRVLVMFFGLFVLAGTAWEFYAIPKGFLPKVDASELQASTLAQQGISFASMKAHTEVLNKIVASDPNTDMFFSSVNGSNVNNGRMFIHLKDPDQRPWTNSPKYDQLVAQYGHDAVLGPIVHAMRPLFEHHLTIEEVVAQLEKRVSVVPGMRVFFQVPPAIRIGGRPTKSQYQYTLLSPNSTDLYRYSALMEAAMKKLPGLEGVTTDLQNKNPQVNVVVDRDKASALGVTPNQVETALYSAYGQAQVSFFYTANNEYRVVMQVLPQYQDNPATLSDLYVQSSSGNLVPLSAVSKFTTSYGPLTVNHTGQLPSVTISFNVAQGVSLGQAVSEVQGLAHRLLPEAVTGSFQGTAQAFQQSLTGLGILLIMAVIVIYLVLGILYESYVHPITILTGLPAAAFGGLFTLSLFHMQLDLYSFVGLIMLIGIVKKNAIMMVDFAISYERAGNESASEAAYQGCMVRFRPIMMTTAAAIMGTLPIAIGFGAGANARRSLGVCVVGGLIFAQIVTLYFTPVFYTYMDSFLKWRKRSKAKAKELAGRLPGPQEALLAPHSKSAPQN